MKPIRVLVVDDSAFARKVVREVLARTEGIDVVGFATDGLDALEQISALKPDVVTLDLLMPNLDGIGVLQALQRSGPRVVVVSVSGDDTELGLEALNLGALDIVRKPTASASARLYDLERDLVAKVRAAAGGRVPSVAPPQARPIASAGRRRGRVELLVLGASTGGPQAITRVLSSLPADFPAPVLVAVHLPAGYTDSFSKRLDGTCAIRVEEAADGSRLRVGYALVAPGGTNLAVVGTAAAAIISIRPEVKSVYVPSIDHLFASAAAVFGSGVLGVVMTGMGDDGTQGARAIREAGGRVLTETEESCVVYGMPRAVKEAGLSDGEAAIDRMAAEILTQL